MAENILYGLQGSWELAEAWGNNGGTWGRSVTSTGFYGLEYNKSGTWEEVFGAKYETYNTVESINDEDIVALKSNGTDIEKAGIVNRLKEGINASFSTSYRDTNICYDDGNDILILFGENDSGNMVAQTASYDEVNGFTFGTQVAFPLFRDPKRVFDKRSLSFDRANGEAVLIYIRFNDDTDHDDLFIHTMTVDLNNDVSWGTEYVIEATSSTDRVYDGPIYSEYDSNGNIIYTWIDDNLNYTRVYKKLNVWDNTNKTTPASERDSDDYPSDINISAFGDNTGFWGFGSVDGHFDRNFMIRINDISTLSNWENNTHGEDPQARALATSKKPGSDSTSTLVLYLDVDTNQTAIGFQDGNGGVDGFSSVSVSSADNAADVGALYDPDTDLHLFKTNENEFRYVEIDGSNNIIIHEAFTTSQNIITFLYDDTNKAFFGTTVNQDVMRIEKEITNADNWVGISKGSFSSGVTATIFGKGGISSKSNATGQLYLTDDGQLTSTDNGRSIGVGKTSNEILLDQ